MSSWMFFSTVNSSIWRYKFIIFRLSARPFSGSSGKAAPPLVGFLPRLVQSDYTYYYLFLQGVSQHLGYLISLVSQPFPIWTFIRGIRSNIEGPFLLGCFRRFWRSLRSGQRIFLNISARSGVSVTSNLFGDLRSGHLIFEWTTACLVVFLSGGSRSSQSSPWFLGDLPHSQRYCFSIVSVSW